MEEGTEAQNSISNLSRVISWLDGGARISV